MSMTLELVRFVEAFGKFVSREPDDGCQHVTYTVKFPMGQAATYTVTYPDDDTEIPEIDW